MLYNKLVLLGIQQNALKYVLTLTRSHYWELIIILSSVYPGSTGFAFLQINLSKHINNASEHEHKHNYQRRHKLNSNGECSEPWQRFRLTNLHCSESVTEVVSRQQVLFLRDPRLFLLNAGSELLVGEGLVQFVAARVGHLLQFLPVGGQLLQPGADLLREQVRLSGQLLSRLLDSLWWYGDSQWRTVMKCV